MNDLDLCLEVILAATLTTAPPPQPLHCACLNEPWLWSYGANVVRATSRTIHNDDRLSYKM